MQVELPEPEVTVDNGHKKVGRGHKKEEEKEFVLGVVQGEVQRIAKPRNAVEVFTEVAKEDVSYFTAHKVASILLGRRLSKQMQLLILNPQCPSSIRTLSEILDPFH